MNGMSFFVEDWCVKIWKNLLDVFRRKDKDVKHSGAGGIIIAEKSA